MRKLLSLLAVAAAVTVVAQHPTKMTVTMRSGDVITYQIADIDSIWFSGESTTPTPGPPPSARLWLPRITAPM